MQNFPDLTPEQLLSRYQLLCKACQPESQLDNKLNAELAQLESLIKHDLIALTRQRSPDGVTDILQALTDELMRFRLFCEFPHLADKTIVGIGGGFSTGKSSLINSLIGHKRLVVEIDPTTSMPAYVLKGNRSSITAINHYQCAIELSQKEFNSLTHEEKFLYGSQVGRMLKAAFITEPDFKWDNLAFLDTPGYSKPDEDERDSLNDENIAKTQLNAANYIIWVVSAEMGVISEQDIRFLGGLDSSIPKLVVISRADKRQKRDIADIVKLTKQTLKNRGISVLDVVPYSARKQTEYLLNPILEKLNQWNENISKLTFAQNFKRQFLSYQRFLEQEQYSAQHQLHKLNRILSIVEDETIQNDVQNLLTITKNELTQLEQLKDNLSELSHQFFTKLKTIGDFAGVALPEPSVLDVMDIEAANLNGLLDQLIAEEEDDEPYESQILWQQLHLEKPEITRINKILAKKLLGRHSDLDQLTSYEQHQYVVLHAAFLLNNGILNEYQEKLYHLWLASFKHNLSLPDILERAQNIQLEQLKEGLALLENKNLEAVWLLDLLNFARFGAEISFELRKLLDHWYYFSSLYDDDIKTIVAFSDRCFSIENKCTFDHDDDVVVSIANNPIWVKCYAPKLFEFNHIDSGLWLIDHQITINKNITIKNCILIFDGDGHILHRKEDNNTNADVKCDINDAVLIRPRFIFNGIHLVMKNIKAISSYKENKQDLAFSLISAKAFSISDCYFQLTNVDAFLFSDRQYRYNTSIFKNVIFNKCSNLSFVDHTTLTNCQFQSCEKKVRKATSPSMWDLLGLNQINNGIFK